LAIVRHGREALMRGDPRKAVLRLRQNLAFRPHVKTAASGQWRIGAAARNARFAVAASIAAASIAAASIAAAGVAGAAAITAIATAVAAITAIAAAVATVAKSDGENATIAAIFRNNAAAIVLTWLRLFRQQMDQQIPDAKHRGSLLTYATVGDAVVDMLDVRPRR
jgi:hypothetical protein